jgi:hypothetical protein
VKIPPETKWQYTSRVFNCTDEFKSNLLVTKIGNHNTSGAVIRYSLTWKAIRGSKSQDLDLFGKILSNTTSPLAGQVLGVILGWWTAMHLFYEL